MDHLVKLKGLALPFAELLGIEFVDATPDRVVAEMTVREDLCTRPAVMHGGAIMAFADTLGAAGTILNLPEGRRHHDGREQDQLHRRRAAGRQGTRRGDPGASRPPHQVWQTRITLADTGRLVALVSQTQLVL